MINALYVVYATNPKDETLVLNFINKSEAYDAQYKLQSKGFTVDFSGYGYQIIRKESQLDEYIDMFTD